MIRGIQGNGGDFKRPRGDITTILDIADRDGQDNYMFPLTTEDSWFHRDEAEGGAKTAYPNALSIQEFTQRGPADWGQFFSFEIGSLPAGDLLQGIILQFRLGHWYDPSTINELLLGRYQALTGEYPDMYWTWANSVGSSIIEYAEFIVGDQTIEKLDGDFIRCFLNIYADANSQFGISTDGLGTISSVQLDPAVVEETSFNPNRPWPTENGVYFCLLPFFFLRTHLKEVFPLLSCNEGSVRINVKLRPFQDMVRNYSGFRTSCTDTPLGKKVFFKDLLSPDLRIVEVQTAVNPPIFQDFRILTISNLIDGSVRNSYIRRSFEQMVKIVQRFEFDEPLKYITAKANSNSDVVEVSLPLELNHPIQELLWVFRRKGVAVNNDWYSFAPFVSSQSKVGRIFPGWLESASLRINGSEVISADGEWFREHISSVHKGGWISYNTYMYGYSFSQYPDEHQPSGTANMSRTNSVVLNLRINTPISMSSVKKEGFEPEVNQGWEVFVYAIGLQWLRFENGICNRMFTD